jgi:ABC-type dipeptide/oligopeptide/nickel transport system permease component
VIPFSLLLSRDLKRNKKKMIWLTCFMIFARCVDMFWLIVPNFKGAAGNLVGEPISILAYITVPACVLSLWGAYYLTELMRRPLVNVNDPHLEEILEPEHAH